MEFFLIKSILHSVWKSPEKVSFLQHCERSEPHFNWFFARKFTFSKTKNYIWDILVILTHCGFFVERLIFFFDSFLTFLLLRWLVFFPQTGSWCPCQWIFTIFLANMVQFLLLGLKIRKNKVVLTLLSKVFVVAFIDPLLSRPFFD